MISTKLELETPRLLLRQWKDSDFGPFAKMNADPIVMEHLQGPRTFDQTVEFIHRINDRFSKLGYGLFAIELKDKRQFAGFVGLWPANFENEFTRQHTPCLEVGWRLEHEY